MAKTFLISGAVFGLLSVAIGAFGAHALKAVLDDYAKGLFHTAVQYQMFHSAALILTGLLMLVKSELSLQPSGWAFIIGILIFSGSLYLLAITGNRMLGAITPIGGLSFMAGWAWMIFQLLKMKTG